MSTAAARALRSASPVRRSRVLRPSARPLHALLHRDVGALQLLRHARAAHPVHDRAPRGRRPRASTRRRPARSTALYTSMVYLMTLPGGWIADRADRPAHAPCSYGGILIACGHFSMAVPVADDVLPRPRADRHRHRPAQRQHQRHRRPAVRAGRQPARRRLLDLLHGHQPRRVHRAARLRLSRAARQLALGLRRGRRRHGARPRAVRRSGASISATPACTRRSAASPEALARQKRQARALDRRRRRACSCCSASARLHRRPSGHADADRRRRRLRPARRCRSSSSPGCSSSGDWTPAERNHLDRDRRVLRRRTRSSGRCSSRPDRR